MVMQFYLDPEPCPVCVGSGKDPKKRKRPCPNCRGTGKISRCRECEKHPCSCGVLY